MHTRQFAWSDCYRLCVLVTVSFLYLTEKTLGVEAGVGGLSILTGLRCFSKHRAAFSS